MTNMIKFLGSRNTWLKFESYDFTQESKKAFRTTYKDLMKRDIEGPEALDFVDFGNIHGGRALQDLDEFYHDHVVELDVVDMVVFQLGGAKRRCPEKSKIVGAYIIKRITMSLGLMSNVSLRVVTIGQDTSLLDVVKLVELGIISYNGLGQGEIVEDKLVDSEDEVDAAKARRAQDENKGSPRRRSNMSFTNRLRVMDDRLRIMRRQGEVPLLELKPHELAGVQQGVNFTSSPRTYSIAPFATPADSFGLFGSLGDAPSTSQRLGNDTDED
ncbi:hypothetical protein Tco_0786041 [Tanacetum coccineum]